jgi:hypothetical protein
MQEPKEPSETSPALPRTRLVCLGPLGFALSNIGYATAGFKSAVCTELGLLIDCNYG